MSAEPTPLLSACMIVRDEADMLGQAIECLRPVCDEIVVVDTGSRDAAPEIARTAGAVVHSIAWTDDFAAARNVALRQARGDWILVLDAHEWILPEEGVDLRRLLAASQSQAFTLRQQTYVQRAGFRGFIPNDSRCERAASYPGYLLARQTRLFPNDPRIRYEGIVHEEVRASLDEIGIERTDLDLVVHHFGKVREEAVRERKQVLYTRLGERKAASAEDPQAWRELAIQYLELGRDDDARDRLARASAALEDGPERAHAVATLAKIEMRGGRMDGARQRLEEELPRIAGWLDPWEVLGELPLRSGEIGRGIEVLGQAIKLFPDQPHLLRLLAERHLVLRQWSEADATVNQLVALVPADDAARRLRFLSRVRRVEPQQLADLVGELGDAESDLRLLLATADSLWREGERERAWCCLRVAPRGCADRSLALEGRWRQERGELVLGARLRARVATREGQAEHWSAVAEEVGLELILRGLNSAVPHASAALPRALAFARAGVHGWAQRSLVPLDADPRTRQVAQRARMALQARGTLHT